MSEQTFFPPFSYNREKRHALPVMRTFSAGSAVAPAGQRNCGKKFDWQRKSARI
jgi:hypothetical protein